MSNLVLDYEFEAFATRKSFNRNLTHFKGANALIADLESGKNFADAVNTFLGQGEMEGQQVLPLVRALLVEKYSYQFFSLNIKTTVSDTNSFASEFQAWTSLDLVFVYFHPESGVVLVNPKNPEHWKALPEMRRNELLMVYLGLGTKGDVNDKAFKNIATAVEVRIFSLLSGEKLGKLPSTLANGKFVFKAIKVAKAPSTKAVPRKSQRGSVTAPIKSGRSSQAQGAAVEPQPAQVAPSAVGGKSVVSPKIPIQVTNELFHNGNVEAWKRIIQSYTSKYPQCRVNIYYDGELIHDINSLFKWGKVKHGTSILVSLATTDEKLLDLSKLRKYLLEGASPRFEFFLKGAPGTTLDLF
ncbi:MAG: hypothetical protein HKM05_00740 [Spirochaetales bacterium]|nr:hypothetical protein [Spirochaetales bacterium]